MPTSFALTFNNIATTAAQAYTAGSGSLTVTSAAGIVLTAGQWVRVSTFHNSVPQSIFKATAVNGNVLTLAGAIEGTTDQSLAFGDAVELRITAGAFTDLQAAVNTLETTAATLAPLGSPALIGVPTAPTASAGTNTTQIATTAFVTSAVGAGGGGTSIGAAVGGGTANNVLFVGATGLLAQSGVLTFLVSSSAPALTLGDGTSGPRLFLNYASNSGGDLTGKMAGVEELSFGFNNLATFGGGATGLDSGRQIYIYDRIGAKYLGGIGGNDASLTWGPSNTSYSLKATPSALGFYSKPPIAQQANTAGAATASASYTSTEQKMLNDCYSVLRNLGLLS